MTALRIGTLLLLAIAAGCAGDGSRIGSDDMLGDTPDDRMDDRMDDDKMDDDKMEPPGVTLADIQQDVFSAICINCHVTGGTADFLVLDSEQNSLASLVNVLSLEVPSLVRVAPGDPDQSYLVWKIEGQGPNGEPILGERMPPASAGEAPLSAKQIADIRSWILDGALP